MKILIAEDNEDSRLILRKTLESEGYEVQDATNGAEALKFAKESPPEMIISDILMPEMDGFRFCREVKADRKLRRIPFIFYTATYTDPEDERLAMSLGASRFILKPLEHAQFLKIVYDVIQEYSDHTLVVPGMAREEEAELQKMYDDRISRKLDKKIRELQKERMAFKTKEAELRASEEKYRVLMESANDAIFIADAETGIIIDANKEAGKMLGIPQGKIIGMYQTQLHPPEDVDQYRAIFQRHIRTKKAISEKLFVINSTGQKVPVEISASVAEIGGKKIIQGIFRNMTERLQTEEALREERNKAQRYLDIAGVIILALDAAGRITLLNQKGCEILRCRAEEVIGSNWFDNFLPKRTKQEVSAVYERIMAGEIEPLEYYENPVLTKSGEERLIAWHNTQLKDEGGNIIGTLSSGQDITEHKMAEEALHESEERFRTIFESSPMGIIIVTPEGIIVHSNPSYQQMVGYARDELNRSFLELTHPDDAAKHLILFNEMVAGKRDHYSIEKRFIAKNKTMVWVNLSATAVRDAGGKFKYLFSLVEDMSERKKLEDQLRHAQKMEAVGQLAGGMAHDFNNLLTAVIGYASLIKMKLKNDGQLLQAVHQILDISARGASLTQGLLAFSRKQIVALNPVRLNELVQRAGKLLPRLIGEEIEIKIRPAKEELMILADSGHIEQVIVNIATNARDAMPQGGTFIIETARQVLDNEAVVSHGYGAPGEYALISLTDTGQGIDASARGKLFEPFFTTKEVGKGTGLGLAIVYGIIKQHKGYISVYSEVGQGTTFRIYLPLITRGPVEEETGKTHPLMGGTETILLAEDENKVRKALAVILREFGFTIIEACNGEDAIQKFRDNKDSIQLIIMDVVMPRKSGSEAYTEIQQIRPDVPVIFISGYTENTIHDKGIQNEGVNFISKPFHPKDMLQKIREVLDR